MVNRLKVVMSCVVPEDQTCGVRERTSSLNLQLIRDAITWVKERDRSSRMINIDQEKAFDCVSQAFLFQVLQKMNFGPGFIRWIYILYNDVYSLVNVNGYMTEPVIQGGGVRQGCPMSPLLYVLFIEPFAEMIRSDNRIHGVHLPGSWGQFLKIAQYADDTTICLTVDGSVDRVLQLMNRYSKGTGSKINVTKSSIMYYGSWANRKDARGGIHVCEDGIKILGVYLRMIVQKEIWRSNWKS